jgi:aminobenzoyl-glutamate utilization protein B
MAEIVQSNIELAGMPTWTAEEQSLAKATQKAAGVIEAGLMTKISPLKQATQGTSSNDSGDITWTTPHGRITFPSNVPDVAFHHWEIGRAHV